MGSLVHSELPSVKKTSKIKNKNHDKKNEVVQNNTVRNKNPEKLNAIIQIMQPKLPETIRKITLKRNQGSKTNKKRKRQKHISEKTQSFKCWQPCITKVIMDNTVIH